MPPSPAEIRVQLDRLLASETFAGAGRLSRFLRYVVERTLAGEADKLKEYAIGVDVFDRGEQYDPRVDSIVRVEAGRLRAKVEEYYNREGSGDAVIIRLRRGGYAPLFEQRQMPVPPPVADGSSALMPSRRTAGWRIALAVSGSALLLGAIAAWRGGPSATSDTSAPLVTIAVLPFAHYSADEADALLAARMTDGVTSQLARVGTLGVVSHTSARQFAGVRKPLRAIADALNARFIMEGTMLKEGNRVRVDARLVDAARDRKFWVDEFEGTVTNLPELQRQIARGIAAAAIQRAATP